MNALGIYIFAGGFTLGVRKHFDVLAHFEDGLFGVETFKMNFPDIPVFVDPDEWPVKNFAKKADFVYCNPPCAPWSATGVTVTQGRDAWKTDPRVECVHNSFNHGLKGLRPKVWVWESVTRAFTNGRSLVDQLTQEAVDLGYSVTYFLTDAQLHGLPQQRKRFHMVVHNVELDFVQPAMKLVTVRQALAGVKQMWAPPFCKTDASLVKHTKPGEGLRDAWERLNKKKVLAHDPAKGKLKGRPGWIRQRLTFDKPSITLVGGSHAIHPMENRNITPLEQAVLCGYPKTYKWAGPESSWYPQISRAVTPVIGEYLARVAKAGIEQGKKTKGKINTVDFRPLRKELEGAR